MLGGQIRSSDPLVLEFRMVVNHVVLGIEPLSSAQSVSPVQIINCSEDLRCSVVERNL